MSEVAAGRPTLHGHGINPWLVLVLLLLRRRDVAAVGEGEAAPVPV
jgi:hypothetical protein